MIKKRALDFIKAIESFDQIKLAGDPILRRPTEGVEIQEGLVLGKRLGEILVRYRKMFGSGRGLAAPQIGIGKSVFVTFVDEKVEMFINPKIITKSNRCNYYRELCLSCGIMSADTKRPEWVRMEWWDEKGIKQNKKVEGFLARLYQHEEAHLRGKLNIDEARPGGIEFATFDPLLEKLRYE